MKIVNIFKATKDNVRRRNPLLSIGLLFCCSVFLTVLIPFISKGPVGHAQSHDGWLELARVGCVLEGCVPQCGNGIMEAPDEECDPPDYGGATCDSFGYGPGCTIWCNDCKFQVVPPPTPTPTPMPTPNSIDCGNGVQEPGNYEQCDGADFGPVDLGTYCEDIGGYPDRFPECIGEDCFIDDCPCGDKLFFDELCYGGVACDEIFSLGNKFDCEKYAPWCSWDDDNDRCAGVTICSEWEDAGHPCKSGIYCYLQPDIYGCFGPEIDCGVVGDVVYDSSGEFCSLDFNCPPLGIQMEYWTGKGCEPGVFLINLGDSQYILTNYDGTHFTVRKVLVMPPRPDPLTGLTATPGVGEITLTWDVPGDPGIDFIDFYEITYGVGTAPVSGQAVQTIETHQGGGFTVTGLDSGTTYWFRVRAVNKDKISDDEGKGDSSYVSATTL